MSLRRSWIVALTCLGAAGAASAQYDSGFEVADGISASASGTILTGQDGYYIPVTGSTDAFAYTYSGNALGFPQNPQGGSQFVGGTGPGNATFVRAQRDMSWGTGQWTITFDMCVGFSGQLPATQNVGSVSSQPFPGNGTFILLNTWSDVNTATAWDAEVIYFNAADQQLQVDVPDPAFQNLPINRWFERSATVDFDTNRILSVSITDLTTNASATYEPTDWYLDGGSGGQGTPTGFRFFAGGSSAGNAVGWDNMSIAPASEDLSISVSGTCPGRVDVSYENATPDTTLALLFAANTGNVVIPNGPCAGTQLGLGANQLQVVRQFNSGNGSGQTGGNVPGRACGGFLQMIEAGSCATSNVAQLP